jgi:autotransporter passenger strand-loop-strand repeat protein
MTNYTSDTIPGIVTETGQFQSQITVGAGETATAITVNSGGTLSVLRGRSLSTVVNSGGSNESGPGGANYYSWYSHWDYGA